MIGDSRRQLSAGEVMAVPQPTAADVQAYLEFLAERHPQLLDALERVAEALVAEGVDLRRLAHPDAGDPPLVITPPSE